MRRLKIFLNGTWVGHPLHPALTDVSAQVQIKMRTENKVRDEEGAP
jgi:hypothetical protein